MSDTQGIPHRARPGSIPDADAWRAHLAHVARILDEQAERGEWPDDAAEWPDPGELGPLPEELATEVAALRARIEQRAVEVARRMTDVRTQLDVLRATEQGTRRGSVYVDVQA
jgi:hypothetical protein